ncbi:MAG: hypothetical protein KGI71_04390 [Patescibacteria group bacterium]|nr:hypothetical protein [Patescibacteria group bacterium]
MSDPRRELLADLACGWKLRWEDGTYYAFPPGEHVVSDRVVGELSTRGFLQRCNGNVCFISDEGKLAYIKSTDEMQSFDPFAEGRP